jgi:transcriptional regulator with XRE-family HTH domain
MKSITVLSPIAKEALLLFATLIDTQRRKKGFSQMELAQRCGVSRSTIQNVLKGDPSVVIGTYFETAAILGVSLFTDDSIYHTQLVNQTEEILSLLPNRIHSQKEILDDSF